MEAPVATLSRDTHPSAEAVQIALIRQASPAQRLQRVRSLTATTVELARRAIRRRHPDWSEDEVSVRFVELHYGADLAAALRRRLAADAR